MQRNPESKSSKRGLATPIESLRGGGLEYQPPQLPADICEGRLVALFSWVPKVLIGRLYEYENIPEVVFWQVQTKEIEDITGICVLVGTWGGANALEPSDYARLTGSAMGIDLTEEELMLIGRRAANLEKAFNTIHTGFDREDDYPPRRYMEEPIESGPFVGHKCDKEKWDEMLDRFYELHGWDKKTGWQTRQCLMELGLEDVAQKLEKAGRLIY